MEAPEKIYVHVKNDKVTNAWNSMWKGVRDVEYIHKDAFIEKACEWLEPVLKNYAGYYTGKDILGDFKNYMERE